jgi:hypothetical protein
MMLIIGQWSITILILLPPICLSWYVRLPTDEYCLVPYTNLLAESYHIVMIYMIPLVFITTVYIWITTFIRYSSPALSIRLAANQRQRNLRDLTVIKRIIILISVLVALRFPTVIFMIYAVTVGHLYRFTFSIVGLITSVCMIFIGLMMIYITPQLRKNHFFFSIYRDNRVYTLQTFQQRLTVSTIRRQIGTLQQSKVPSKQRQTVPQ